MIVCKVIWIRNVTYIWIFRHFEWVPDWFRKDQWSQLRWPRPWKKKGCITIMKKTPLNWARGMKEVFQKWPLISFSANQQLEIEMKIQELLLVTSKLKLMVFPNLTNQHLPKIIYPFLLIALVLLKEFHIEPWLIYQGISQINLRVKIKRRTQIYNLRIAWKANK